MCVPGRILESQEVIEVSDQVVIDSMGHQNQMNQVQKPVNWYQSLEEDNYKWYKP